MSGAHPQVHILSLVGKQALNLRSSRKSHVTICRNTFGSLSQLLYQSAAIYTYKMNENTEYEVH